MNFERTLLNEDSDGFEELKLRCSNMKLSDLSWLDALNALVTMADTQFILCKCHNTLFQTNFTLFVSTICGNDTTTTKPACSAEQIIRPRQTEEGVIAHWISTTPSSAHFISSFPSSTYVPIIKIYDSWNQESETFKQNWRKLCNKSCCYHVVLINMTLYNDISCPRCGV